MTKQTKKEIDLMKLAISVCDRVAELGAVSLRAFHFDVKEALNSPAAFEFLLDSITVCGDGMVRIKTKNSS